MVDVGILYHQDGCKPIQDQYVFDQNIRSVDKPWYTPSETILPHIPEPVGTHLLKCTSYKNWTQQNFMLNHSEVLIKPSAAAVVGVLCVQHGKLVQRLEAQLRWQMILKELHRDVPIVLHKGQYKRYPEIGYNEYLLKDMINDIARIIRDKRHYDKPRAIKDKHDLHTSVIQAHWNEFNSCLLPPPGYNRTLIAGKNLLRRARDLHAWIQHAENTRIDIYPERQLEWLLLLQARFIDAYAGLNKSDRVELLKSTEGQSPLKIIKTENLADKNMFFDTMMRAMSVMSELAGKRKKAGG